MLTRHFCPNYAVFALMLVVLGGGCGDGGSGGVDGGNDNDGGGDGGGPVV